MTKLRRYELFLPLRFNDGSYVPEDLPVEVFLELRERFGGASSETQVIRGLWGHGETIFRDELNRMFVDVADTVDNQQYFVGLKERLKTRFKQVEIWITTYQIETV
jgi:hypothetical protein